eukprot:CAMPEP_0182418028 /NCGR_PEP_ID=MMETSP1167-20130531/2484_1 /TAXON_ID=2988 /ORGANISM="Mallomonas Sp, Strain CCMP3275" /LENGTH=125 /DNA_ID=CAMNT_0024591981 /DNA_START=211 /DNA_END=588 /DNA_ORIENTATION=-
MVQKYVSRIVLTKSNNDISNATEDIIKAMENARKGASDKLSPGAGLSTAEEQAEAAYADLINTSMDQRGISELSVDELKELSRGGRMWEKGAVLKSRKWGVFGDMKSLVSALSGGAHIDNNESKI